MEIFFKILAVILGGVAAYFLWTGNADRAFATAVFGAVSFFLSVRVEVKKRNAIREAERLRKEEEEEQKSEGEFEDDFEDEVETPQLNEMPAKTRIESDIQNPKSKIQNPSGEREI